MGVRTSVPSLSSFTWESLKALPQGDAQRVRAALPSCPPPAPQLLPCLQHRAWEAAADRSVSCLPSSRSQPGQVCGGNRMGWSRWGKLSPPLREITRLAIKQDKATEDKDQLVQTQAFHRPAHYIEPDINKSQHSRPGTYKEQVLTPTQASQRTRCYPQNMVITEPGIYTAPGHKE